MGQSFSKYARLLGVHLVVCEFIMIRTKVPFHRPDPRVCRGCREKYLRDEDVLCNKQILSVLLKFLKFLNLQLLLS